MAVKLDRIKRQTVRVRMVLTMLGHALGCAVRRPKAASASHRETMRADLGTGVAPESVLCPSTLAGGGGGAPGTIPRSQIPEKSGWPSAVLGAGASRFIFPFGNRGADAFL